MHRPTTFGLFVKALRLLRERLVLMAFLFGGQLHAEPYLGLSAELHVYSVMAKEDPRSEGSAAVTNVWTVNVQCVVGTDEWQLEGNFSGNGIDNWHFDGTNLLVARRITTPASVAVPDFPPDSPLAVFLPENPDLSSSTVYLYDEPPGYLPGNFKANLAWLALCSGQFLRTPERRVPLPILDVRISPDSMFYRDETEYFEDGLRLPRWMSFYTSRALYDKYLREEHAPQTPERVRTLKADMVDGLSVFEYRVVESTNFLGFNVPLTFEFSTKNPIEQMGRHFLRWGHGRVLTLGSASGCPGVWDDALEQTVVDFRFSDRRKRIRSHIYSWSHSHLPSTSDPLLIASFAERVQRAPNPDTRERIRRVAVGLVLLILVGMPIVLYLSKRSAELREKGIHYQ